MTHNSKSASNDRSILPVARTKDIVLQETGQDVLIYDVRSKKAHHLNETVYFVWTRCNGKNLIEDVASELTEKFGAKVGCDFIWLAIDELSKIGLVNTSVHHDRISSRKALLRYALPAVVFPAVVSLVAPQTADAQSCLGLNALGCTTTPCCPELFCNNGVGVGGTGQCQNNIN